MRKTIRFKGLKTKILFLGLSLIFSIGILNAQNPVEIKAEDYTDAQIIELLNQAKASGLGVDQAEQLAMAQGLQASEAQAFRNRISKIQAQMDQTAKAGTPAQATKQATEVKAKEAIVEAATPITGSEIVAAKQPVKVSVYGQELFRNGDIKVYERSIDAKAPDNYELGIGDEIGISLFGISYYNTVVKVDERGWLEMGQLGSIYVKGMPFNEAKLLIRTNLKRNFNMAANQLEISLAYSRSITVNIVGEVFKPGSYKIPALNTVFNALIVAGGPTDIGTLRNVQLRRNGKVIKVFDVYAYLQNPGSDDDFFLQDNDYLVVGTVGKLISIGGAVKRPMVYELLPSENLTKIIQYAGSLNADALRRNMVLSRFVDKNIQLIPVNYDSLVLAKTDFVLNDGDQITVPSINSDLDNQVVIKGPVFFPGNYALKPNEKISDLIAKAGGLREQALLKRAFIIRTEKDNTRSYLPLNIDFILSNTQGQDNFMLKRNDVLLLYSEAEFLNKFTISTNGEIKAPNTFEFKDGMTLGDALVLSGGLKISAEISKISIARSNIFSPGYVPGEEYKTTLIEVQIPKDVTDSATILNMKLLPFDLIVVRRIPNFEFQKTVSIVGEVKYPGVYVIQNKNLRVQDLIQMAGGLTRYAFLRGAKFDRPTVPGGYMVFDLVKALRYRKSPYNYTIEEGDVITVPTTIEYVSIFGTALNYLEVSNNNVLNAPYMGSKRAGYYIRQFGNGYTKNAWKSRTYVVEANGRIRKTSNLYLFRISPKVRKGATVNVVFKEQKEQKQKTLKDQIDKADKIQTDWNKIISDLSVKLTAFATLWALLTRL